MVVGLLLCDRVRPEFLHLGGDYPDYFAKLLPEVLWKTFAVSEGELPQSPSECDAWVTSGSHRSVYEDVPWIREFVRLMRSFDKAKAPTVGICFGVQMMALALGGRVVRAEQGWQVGVKETQVLAADTALGPESFRIIHSNADQIVELPSQMRLLATSPMNPVEVVAVGEHFLGFQGHPEFTVEYSAALMNARRGTLIPSDVVDAGLASLSPPPDRDRLAGMLKRFLAV